MQRRAFTSSSFTNAGPFRAGYFHLCIAVSHDFFSKLTIPTKRKKSIGNNLEGIMFADDRISMQIINKFL